jgi:5-methylcytosine-specific restriction endonuclease McrA
MDRALERLVWRRAGERCEYCQLSQLDLDLAFEIDHIIAEHHQGRTQANNLCLACFACNRHKGPNVAGIDPRTGKIVPLFNPRRHKWSRHFRWDGPMLIGRTPNGRATVIALKINLDHRIDLRQGLIDEGVFPPG